MARPTEKTVCGNAVTTIHFSAGKPDQPLPFMEIDMSR